MIECKNLLREIIELFYQPTFKIFNINSIDEKTLIKPIGYFISLGITTSFRVMNDLKNILNNSDYGFSAKLVEIKSVYSNTYKDYLNVIQNKPESELSKFNSPEKPGVLNKSDAENKIREYEDRIIDGDYSASYSKQKLIEVLNKIENYEGSWDNHYVLVGSGENDFGIFHRKINYKKDSDNTEYRIGIYVTKN